jgi:hypothetical protein
MGNAPLDGLFADVSAAHDGWTASSARPGLLTRAGRQRYAGGLRTQNWPAPARASFHRAEGAAVRGPGNIGDSDRFGRGSHHIRRRVDLWRRRPCCSPTRAIGLLSSAQGYPLERPCSRHHTYAAGPTAHVGPAATGHFEKRPSSASARPCPRDAAKRSRGGAASKRSVSRKTSPKVRNCASFRSQSTRVVADILRPCH